MSNLFSPVPVKYHGVYARSRDDCGKGMGCTRLYNIAKGLTRMLCAEKFNRIWKLDVDSYQA